jgi:5'-3' exoribonuclease 1
MGVPKFYRWISERYPFINQIISDTSLLPEFDNLYLDMNGIIHYCSHPSDTDQSKEVPMKDLIWSIFRYIDRMVSEIAKPKKVLFMAIDGVSPRAKLNQQRSRRFRAAQDRTESIAQSRAKGDEVDENSLFDSNCITPGTEFMSVISTHLKWYIRKKIKEDPIWRDLEVIFSGHEVPGEGEHKIMQYIRDERIKPGFLPNTRHCMYGQDADLIMLGLSCHEPHFTLLREVVSFGGGFNKTVRQTSMKRTTESQFQLLNISVLREYIELDLGFGIDWSIDKERLFDDFIFLTFLVGNDFLPHLPTLDISEHAFDVIFKSYKELLIKNRSYIVKDGELHNFIMFEQLCALIGEQEEEILSNRDDDVKTFNEKKRKYKNSNILTEEELEEAEEKKNEIYQNAIQDALLSLKTSTTDKNGNDTTPILSTSKDYRGRYYFEKFKVLPGVFSKSQAYLTQLMKSYLEGLMWCIAYYSKGCISWTWYYPYHYGPMLKDMSGLEKLHDQIEFKLGSPFRPFQQLLGCLPPASRNLLPRSYQWLMINDESPVLDSYPLEFEIDQDGKKNPWEAVVKLPFIDEVKLMQAEKDHCNPNLLTINERNRNSFGKIYTFKFDPNESSTFYSSNPEIGLSDILNSQTSCSMVDYDTTPSHFFKPCIVDGTTTPISGFPSLSVINMQGIETDSIKINVFGSSSKYRSIILELDNTEFDPESINKKILINKNIFVNYPHMYEAKIVAVSSAFEECRLIINDNGGEEIISTLHERISGEKWLSDCKTICNNYLIGTGTPGTGGLKIGDIKIRLKVILLQGIKRDYLTGSTKKVFGKDEVDIPIQLAIWTAPTIDHRFIETGELSMNKLMPIGSEIISIKGPLLGCKGTVVGPHTNDDIDHPRKLKSKSNSESKRVVDVEFLIPPQDTNSFGYAISNSIKDIYYQSKDVCKQLQISPAIMGKIIGSILVESPKGDATYDLGLNLKRNGQYQLLGFCRKIEINQPLKTGNIWANADTVKIIGNLVEDEDVMQEKEQVNWEFSTKAIALLIDYKAKFPILFNKLSIVEHKKKYSTDELLGNNKPGHGVKVADTIMEWMKAQPFFNQLRTTFSTSSVSKDAMKAIERAADVMMASINSLGMKKVLVKGVNLDMIYRGSMYSTADTKLEYNQDYPSLGDRVVNLTALGVPFGLKGTVISIHSSTGYVEVLYDEEFVGGAALAGSCSNFRGRLCNWSALIKTSKTRPPQKQQSKQVFIQNVVKTTTIETNKSSNNKDKSITNILKKIVSSEKKTESKEIIETSETIPNKNNNISALLKNKLNISGDVKNKNVKVVTKSPKIESMKKIDITSIITKKPIPVEVSTTDKEEIKEENDIPVVKSDGTGLAALAAASGFDQYNDLPTPQAFNSNGVVFTNIPQIPQILQKRSSTSSPRAASPTKRPVSPTKSRTKEKTSPTDNLEKPVVKTTASVTIETKSNSSVLKPSNLLFKKIKTKGLIGSN